MPRARTPARQGSKAVPAARKSRPRGAGVPSAATLRRRLAQALAEQAAHARRVAALRRAHDRKITALVREIASLRHHEARADALTRLVTERDATLAGQAERIAQLEALLREQAILR